VISGLRDVTEIVRVWLVDIWQGSNTLMFAQYSGASTPEIREEYQGIARIN
jgi:hypothetical protein